MAWDARAFTPLTAALIGRAEFLSRKPRIDWYFVTLQLADNVFLVFVCIARLK
jgi:hypothetical protein